LPQVAIDRGAAASRDENLEKHRDSPVRRQEWRAYDSIPTGKEGTPYPMTPRFAFAVLFLLVAFAGLLYAAEVQREINTAYTSRLEPLPVPKDPGALHKPRG
jgi:hypothetical protein